MVKSSKEIDIGDADQYGKKLIKDFLRLFNRFSIENREYGRFALHLILGQLLKNVAFTIDARRIDIRTHLLLIQSSGSGKGAGYGILCEIMEGLGCVLHKVTKVTDAGLIGTVDRYNENTDTYEISEGLLKDADFLTMEEAGWLFDTKSPHNEDVLTIIQQSCNPIEDPSGEIEKKLAHGEKIKVRPTCSFLLLSFMPEQFLEKLMSRGIVQRFSVVIRDVGLEERLRILNLMFDKLGVKDRMTYKDEMNSIVKRLKVIQSMFTVGVSEVSEKDTIAKFKNYLQDFKGGVKVPNDIIDEMAVRLSKDIDKKKTTKKVVEMEFTNDARENLRRISTEMVEMIHDASPEAQAKLEEFTIRLAEMLIRLAIHHAVLRCSFQVEVEDTQYAKKYYAPIWRKLMAFIEISMIADKDERSKKHVYVVAAGDQYKSIIRKSKRKGEVITDKKGEKWLRRETLIQALRQTWAYGECSNAAAQSIFGEIERTEKQRNPKAWFVTKKIGSVRYVKLIKELK